MRHIDAVFSARQLQVLTLAADILREDHKMYVTCIDNMPSDQEIMQDGVEECADRLVIDTMHWEGAFA